MYLLKSQIAQIITHETKTGQLVA